MNDNTYQKNVSDFLDQTFYYSGSDIKLSVNGIWLDELSYLQYTPQQQITPLYTVFSQKPVKFLAGSFLIKGILGFNFIYANYLETLIAEGHAKKFGQVENGIIYVESMVIQFNNGTGPVRPVIIMSDVYLSGGVLTASVDGNPVQTIYQFMAASCKKDDVLIN